MQFKSMSSAAEPDSLRGNLANTSIPDLLQFLATSGKTGELQVVHEPSGAEARVYFSAGTLVHTASADLTGMDALIEICGWQKGRFSFHDDVLSPKVSITVALQHALMEAVRIRDERGTAEPSGGKDERSQDMVSTRSSTDVLEDFLKVPGVTSAVVVGRDGFLIESAGGASTVSIEDLGASLAHAINGIEEMGSELLVSPFQDLFVEYGKAVIICKPAGDAILAITAPDATKLGIIRHKVKPLVAELAEFF